MSKGRKPRGICATPEGIKLLRETKASVRVEESKPLTYERLAAKAKVSTQTVKRFFSRKGVEPYSAISIIQALGLEDKKQEILPLEDLSVEKTIKSIETQSTASPDRSGKLIEKLETALGKLQESKNDSRQAMEWLKANREALSREAAQTVLQKSWSHEISELNTDRSEEIEQFAKEIKRYLRLLYECLDVGAWEFMDQAIQKALIPKDRDSRFYVEALKFIKHKSEILPPESIKELTLCLDYLISIIPIRF